MDQDAPLLRPVPGERKFLDWPMRLPYSGVDPIALLFATVLARRLDDANQALIELRRQVQACQPRSVIEKTKMEGLLGASGANLVYARYPYDLFAPDTLNS